MNARIHPSLIRLQRLEDARALTRSAQILDERELLQALQNIHSAVVNKDDHYAKCLLDLITDLDGDLHSVFVPEAVEYASEGRELDAFTQRTV